MQIKPVAKAAEKDVPIIACIGASITEGIPAAANSDADERESLNPPYAYARR